MNNEFVLIPNSASLDEKIALLKQNNSVAANIRAEINQSTSNNPCFKKLKGDEETKSRTTLTSPKDNDVENLYNQIIFLNYESEEELLLYIKKILFNVENYYSLLDKLKIKLYQDIVAYTSLASEQSSELEEIRKSIVDLRLKIKALTELEIEEGMQFKKGYVSPYMVTDREKMVAEMEDTFVFITDQKINNIQEILPLLEKILNTHKPLLIIAEDLDNEVISTLVVNKLRGTFNVVAVKAPEFGDKQKNMLEDLAVLTGGKFFSKDLKMDIKDADLTDLGRVRKAVIEKDSTTLIGGAGDKAAIASRVEEIKSQMENSTSDYDKQNYQERLAKLGGGVAIIKVGAATESELKEKKLRIEDALNATRAAVSEGIVIGGGAALASIYTELKDELKSDVVDVQKGIKIVMDSLLSPIAQIAENAGYNAEDIIEKQKAAKENVGFDAKNGEWVDMFEKGIIDPTKVTRSALLNAASISALFITTEAGVASIKEENDAAAMPAGGGMY